MRDAAVCLLGVGSILVLVGCGSEAHEAMDAGADACAGLHCPPPPSGCHYSGGDGCTTCGEVVCPAEDGGPIPDGGEELDAGEDAGVCVDCPAPPDGCRYDGGDCASCGTLVCDEVVCEAGGATVFPDFDRSCADESECVVVVHQADCCGSLVARGIRADQESAFDEAEAACRAMYPGCGCAGRPTEADDGTIGPLPARVACVGGQCTSTFGRESGAMCTAGADECGAGLACCYPCGIPGCDHVCQPACDPSSPGCVDGCLLAP